MQAQVPAFKRRIKQTAKIETMKIRKRELAKVGVFGSVEDPVVVTERDLQEIAETFAEIKKAPIKLGNHWSDNKPRLGSVVAVSYDSKTKTLTGDVEECDELSKAVDDGFYPDCSIGAKRRASDGKMYLHHLAYLGDEPPAIKDLYVDIAEELNADEIAASDSGVSMMPSAKSRMLYLSDSPIESTKEKPIAGTDGGGSSAPPSESASNQEKEQAMTEEEIKRIQAENAALKSENERKDKMLSDSFLQKRNAEKEMLKKAASGKVTAAQLEQLMLLSDSFEDGKTLELSDSNGKRSASPAQVLTEIFEGMPKRMQEGALNLSDPVEPTASKPLASRMLSNI